MSNELAALKSVDFDWTSHLQSVWEDTVHDVPEFNAWLSDDLIDEVLRSDQPQSKSPLGRVVLGGPGSGKTHLVGNLRQRIWTQGGWFILFDLADVNDFWATAALSYLQSLQQTFSNGITQGDQILLKLCERHPSIEATLRKHYREIFSGDSKDISRLADAIYRALWSAYRTDTQRHGSVIQAFVTLQARDPDVSDAAYSWLQGVGAEDSPFGPTVGPRQVVRGLSWLMSLSGPTLLVVDQVDAIVSVHNHALDAGNADEREEQRALAIIDGLSGGLMDLRDVTRRTLTVLSSLDETWQVLRNRALKTATDRFRDSPDYVRPISDGAIGSSIVVGRLAPAYERHAVTPPYASWPFHEDAFNQTIGWLPRQLLKRCDAHLRKCLKEGIVTVLESFESEDPGPPPPPPPSTLDEQFKALCASAPIEKFQDANEGERLFPDLLLDALQCYVLQSDLPDDVDLIAEADPHRRKPALHARLRRVFVSEGAREEHHCFRAIPHANAIAFQARLRAAVTAAGIDMDLPFRHLIIIRRDDPPRGRVTKQLCDDLRNAGGRFIALGTEGLRVMLALQKLLSLHPEGFEAWLKQRKPLCDIGLFREVGLCAEGTPGITPGKQADKTYDVSTGVGGSSSETETQREEQQEPENKQHENKKKKTKPQLPPVSAQTEIAIGRRLIAGEEDQPRTLALDLLPRHTAILAGSGSGKTVLLRRIIEEAALAGVPAIVLDTNNDLARLGDPWPDVPSAWNEADRQKANAYADSVETVVWTPGLTGGNPVVLAPMPDFEGVRDDEDEFRQTVAMAHATLLPLVRATGTTGPLKEGVLMNALDYFARQRREGLASFVRLLSDLPHEVSDIDKADKLANDMSNQIKAAMATNPLLSTKGTALDPETLFTSPSSKTRISVINFSGLPAEEAKQAFVNQLQMTLFSWIKKHPKPEGRPLTGLFVMDEAQNFAPSQKNTPCRESTVALAAQARKYGLGMIFATQVPKGIDNKIISNCTTHFYGRMSAPATIQAIQELIASRSGRADDIGTLKAGQFYFSTEGVVPPEKIATPLCLSHHPQNPLSQEQVVERARASRDPTVST